MDKLAQLKEELITNDMMFIYNNKAYTICPWNKDSVSACTAGLDDNQDFAGIDDLLDNWLIEGKTLKDIIDKIILL